MDHSSFDAFLHSHANISDKARHSWNGTAQSSSANIHWPSVVIMCYTQSCRGNDINDAYDGNDCNDCRGNDINDGNDCNDCNNGNDCNDCNDGNDDNGTTNSFFITWEY
jgi:hypothetical protein